MNSPLILLAAEDTATRDFLQENLTADGYEVVGAENCQHALSLLAVRDPALVLADVNTQTPGLLDAIRAGAGRTGHIDPNTPMIVLTSRADELARVRVFEHDGDDVVTKPFSYAELRGRIRAVMRRAHNQQHQQMLRVGTLKIDLWGREAYVHGEPVALTAKEFDLLAALAKQPARVLTGEELLREVWGYPTACRSRTVHSHAHRLRRKLNDAGADRRLVVNVWGVGWRLCDQIPERAAV